jgi:excisionase family DNA binding protein
MIEIRIGKLADALGVHRNTVSNWIKTGKLDASPTLGRKYRVDENELVQFLEAKGADPDQVRGLIEKAREPEAAGAAAPDHVYGSVMVVGGGISGIQAALDLAESGYFVYLVEKSPGIGGGMAKLDKTFPTNDCAM